MCKNKFSRILCVLLCCIGYVVCSAGDNSPFYQNCVENCLTSNCTQKESLLFSKKGLSIKLLWTCEEDCNYDCMWKTVDAFKKRNWRTPQFFGKWPFIRFLGMQEPASTVFSILNFYVNYHMYNRFKKEVRHDSPYYWMWQLFYIVMLNCWVWSALFHARDVYFTELMDYICAFSTISMMSYCMSMRVINTKSHFIRVFISVVYLVFFLNHVAYLGMRERIDYGYNMEVNILVGTFTSISWFMWCTWNKKRLPHVWKCALFVAMNGLCMLLEILDIPPIFWVFDCHSIWHLSTAPCIMLFHNFVIDDSKYLRKQAFLLYKEDLEVPAGSRRSKKKTE